jgi:hypothetical protein
MEHFMLGCWISQQDGMQHALTRANYGWLVQLTNFAPQQCFLKLGNMLPLAESSAFW